MNSSLLPHRPFDGARRVVMGLMVVVILAGCAVVGQVVWSVVFPYSPERRKVVVQDVSSPLASDLATNRGGVVDERGNK